MENLDVTVLRTLRDWRIAGKRALLATVVRTWGSSPRPVGSIMALCEGGAVVGSVSGGCIEDDLIYQYTQAYASTTADAVHKTIPSGPPAFVKYGVTADEAHRFGLPCGGTLELLLEFDPAAAALAQLVAALELGQLMQRSVRLVDGSVTLAATASPAELVLSGSELVNNGLGDLAHAALLGGRQFVELHAFGLQLCHCFLRCGAAGLALVITGLIGCVMHYLLLDR